MKILKISILLIFISFNSFSQSYLKEISKTFNNGSPMFIDYLEPENLKKVKTEIFDESGRKIFSIQFNPKTGLPEGEFFDLINKGFFKEGVLTCYNCLLVDANSPNVFTYNYNKMNTRVTQGDVINGYLVGEVQYKSFAEDTYRGVDYESSRRYAAAGAGVGFRDVVTYKTGNFKEYNLGKDYLNSKGVREGESIINFGNWYAKLYYKNGIIKNYVAYDSKNISIDSISNDNPIWKVNYKFVKNDGFIVFKEVDNFSNPISNLNSKDLNYQKITESSLIIIGGIQKHNGQFIFTGGPKIGLDNNGLYSLRKIGFLDNVSNYIVGYNYDNQVNNSSTSPNFRMYPPFKQMQIRDNSSVANEDPKIIFNHIYNYLFNNNSKEFETRIYTEDYECNASFDNNLKFIVSALNAKTIVNEDYTTKNILITDYNPYSKYLKNNNYNTYKNSKTVKSSQFDEVLYKYITLQDFFDQYISLTNFLSASKESLEDGHSEIQEIWIWDSISNKYVLFDFTKALELAKESEINSKKIASVTVNEKEVVPVKDTPNDEKSPITNELDQKSNLAIASFISNLEIRYSSEKNTKNYYRPYEKVKEDLNKNYELDLVSINILKPSTEDQVINYITEFSFASNKHIKKFTELMNSDKQYKFYYSDFQRLKIYFKFLDSN